MKYSIIFLIMLYMTLTACSMDVDVDSKPVEAFDIDKDYITHISEDKYFRVTTYIQPVIVSGDPIDIFSTIQYIGSKNTFTIWHGLPNFYHSIVPDNELRSYNVIDQPVANTVFRKDEMILIPLGSVGGWVRDDLSEEQQLFIDQYDSYDYFSLPPGKYTIKGICTFSLTKLEDDYSNNTSFEIVVE